MRYVTVIHNSRWIVVPVARQLRYRKFFSPKNKLAILYIFKMIGSISPPDDIEYGLLGACLRGGKWW